MASLTSSDYPAQLTSEPVRRARTKPDIANWFDGSQIVDDQGEPLELYHGTSSPTPFAAFDTKRQGQTAGVVGGFFFTENCQRALDVYGWRSGGVVVAAHLKITKPLTLDLYCTGTGKCKIAETDCWSLDPTNYFDEHTEEILNYARRHGHDGIVFKDESPDRETADLYVVFDPRQIRSADGVLFGATSILELATSPGPEAMPGDAA